MEVDGTTYLDMSFLRQNVHVHVYPDDPWRRRSYLYTKTHEARHDFGGFNRLAQPLLIAHGVLQ